MGTSYRVITGTDADREVVVREPCRDMTSLVMNCEFSYEGSKFVGE